jgi:hypothetical protein
MEPATFTAHAPPAKDWRPIVVRNETNLWSRAEVFRDGLHEQLGRFCKDAGVEPLLLRSPPFAFPAWVKFEAWQPRTDPRDTERRSAMVVVEPKPYHSHEFELEIALSEGNKTRTITRAAPLNEAEVKALVDHLLNRARRPRFRRFRAYPFQLWREKNEIRGLERDWLGIGAVALGAAGVAFSSIFLPLALALWAVMAWLLVRMHRRTFIVRSEGKPTGEPRTLVRVDSWQTVLFDLGPEEKAMRERLRRVLESGLEERRQFREERIWYWGLDGKEEREQFILTAGRGIVFCQIYRYGRDLYFGWDGHLNRGQWVEQMIASGIDRATGSPISFSRVAPGVQPTTEYDLTDVSCLMEWTHAQITKLLKALIAEKKIDQEIDFKIQRAERREVVASGAAAADTGVATKVRKAFQRTA